MPTRRPSKDQLREFLAGEVTADVAGEIEAFLASDPAALAELERDIGVAEFSESFGLIATGVPDRTADPHLATVIGKLKAGDLTPLDLEEQARRVLDEPFGDGRPGRLGKFEILEVIAAGGMGLVFRGRDPDLQRDVAIKTLSARLTADADARGRFLREARAVALLEHPNILPIYAVEAGAHVPFIVMPVQVGTLAELVEQSGPLSPVRAAKLIAQAADALAVAHEMGIVHRDIKPANLLLDEAGARVFVADFGIASREGAAAADGQLSAMGTPAFAAPEQIEGLDATPQSDLYALGATLHFAMTGSPPGVDPQLVGSIRLRRLLAELLDVDPAGRPSSAGVVAERLRRAVRHRALRIVAASALAAAVLFVALLVGVSLTPLGVTGWANRANGLINGENYFVAGRLGTFGSLGEAAAVSRGRAVLVDFDGERPVAPVRYGMSEPLTIRAAQGRRPVLVQGDLSTPMLLSQAALTLENLSLIRLPTGSPKPKPIVSTVGGALVIRSCCVAVLGEGRTTLPALKVQGSSAKVEVVGSLIYCPRSPWLYRHYLPDQGLGGEPQSAEIDLDGSLIIAMSLAVRGDSQLSLKVDFKNTTVIGNRIIDLGAEHRLEISSRDCVFAIKNTLVWMRLSKDAESRHLVRWDARRNGYAQASPEFGFMRWGAAANSMPNDTPEEWSSSGLFDLVEEEAATISLTEGDANSEELGVLVQTLSHWAAENPQSFEKSSQRGANSNLLLEHLFGVAAE